ncbi:MAG TPA: adenylate/guanylate cyclase domain-containing protein, partial [Ilumatobacteraceae bacterium]|nr:adenylate/guanylate cyclase domain-containing protein [Ilumatobacteraceae bacterium]
MVVPPDSPTFLFTDVVGSTRRWQDHADTMGHDLALHDSILRAAASNHGGYVFSTAGDSFAIAFPTPDAAIDAAIDAQRGLRDSPWLGPPINVRMGAHTGYAESRDGGYFGHAVNVAARVMGLAGARQFVITEAAYAATDVDTHPEVQVRPIGEHRLKSVTEPHQLYQVIGDGLSHVVIIAAPADVGNAPVAHTGYVGRERDVSIIVDAVLGARRVVTLTGIGGVGKTRTAMEIAAIVGGRFEDGVWWCDLTAAVGDAAVAGVVASALDASSLGAADAAQAVVARLRSNTALLVLDNCEHVFTGARQLVNAILVGCPGTTVIATSREPLRLQGETVMPIRPLDAETEGVELLVERASAEHGVGARPNWDPEVLAEICRQLDGIPLALEMAGVRLRSLDASELLARLDDRLRLLNARGAVAGARHETLRAMLDWSVELLDSAETELLRSLGVFASSFDLAAVCAVAAPGGDDIEVLDTLGGLVDKSLVMMEWHAECGARYRLLETIRQYALEDMAAETVATLRERHAAHYAAVADALDERYVAAANFDSYRSQWELEFDNVMGAAEHAIFSADAALLDRLLGAAYSYACLVTVSYRMADVARSALAAGVAAPAAYAVASFFSHDPAEKLELAETGVANADDDGDVRSEYFLLSQV